MNKLKLSPKMIFLSFLALYFLGGLTATILSFRYHFNKEYVGITFLSGAAIAAFLKYKYNPQEIKTNVNQLSFKNSFKISIIVYIVLCLALIYSFVDAMPQYYFPYSYFIIVALISIVILSQILLSEKVSAFTEKIILFETFILSTIVFSSFLLIFPTPYGNDAPYHVNFIENSINTGFIMAKGQYQNYPIFHLLFISIMEICKIENFKIVQFILMLVQNTILLLVFILVKRLFNNKAALISFLLLSVAPYISIPKFIFFPGAFSAVLFVLILYLLFYPKISSSRYSLLFIISSLAIIFIHPMTPLILGSAMIIVFLSSKLQFKKEKINLASILFILVITVSWWMKPSGINTNDLFTYAISSFRKATEISDHTASVQSATLAPTLSSWTIISSDLGYILLVLLAIVGAIYILAKYADLSLKYKKFEMNAVYLAITTLALIPIPYVLAIVYPQSLPSRWFPFIEVFSSIFAGLSVFIIFDSLSRSKLKYLVIILVAGLIFLLVSNPIVNPNTHLYASAVGTKCALTGSELDASNFINQYSNIMDAKGNSKYITLINTNTTQFNYINPENVTTYDKGLIVLRNEDIEKGFTKQSSSSSNPWVSHIYPTKEFYDFLDNSNEVYNGGNLKMYLNGE
jgi:hypothetical protein